LTRRGRIVVVLLVAAVLTVVFSAGRVSSQAGTDRRTAPLAEVVVQPGDTLWSIAARGLPQQDPRSAVDQVQRLNRLKTPTVVPGQKLVLPRP